MCVSDKMLHLLFQRCGFSLCRWVQTRAWVWVVSAPQT